RWSAVPSPLPPFGPLRGEIGVVPAVVYARGDRCVALSGAPRSGKTGLGLKLADRGWELVSDQLLVLRRLSGIGYPYLAPMGLRGRAPEELRNGGRLAGVEQRQAYGPGGAQVVLTRPESLVRVVPVSRRLSGVCLVVIHRDAATGAPELGPTERKP